MRLSAPRSVKAPAPAPARPQLAAGTEGRTIYAVGDIHGRLDLLDRLTAQISQDAGEAERPLWVFLGDYVDRGPQSKGVLDRLIDWCADPALDCVALCGNHEFALIKFLGDASFGPTWMTWGGLQTLRSYGVEPPLLGVDSEGWEAARAAFDLNLPPSHRDFLLDLPFTHEIGDYFFVHAGARPGISLFDQKPDDLLMIREEFIGGTPGFEKIIVHGHTPEPDPVNAGWRIGVDTGAYVTGVLTCARIQGHGRLVLADRARGKNVPSDAVWPLSRQGRSRRWCHGARATHTASRRQFLRSGLEPWRRWGLPPVPPRRARVASRHRQTRGHRLPGGPPPQAPDRPSSASTTGLIKPQPVGRPSTSHHPGSGHARACVGQREKAGISHAPRGRRSTIVAEPPTSPFRGMIFLWVKKASCSPKQGERKQTVHTRGSCTADRDELCLLTNAVRSQKAGHGRAVAFKMGRNSAEAGSLPIHRDHSLWIKDEGLSCQAAGAPRAIL